MRAIRVHESGGIDTMRLDEIPRPVPGAGEVLVAVKAAGVGPWDRLIREGESGLGQALPLTLGSDISGTVAALGANRGPTPSASEPRMWSSASARSSTCHRRQH